MAASKTPAKRVLTDALLRSLKPAPEGTRYSVPDALVPGLAVRVTDRGAKTFVLAKRWGGSKNPTARAVCRVGELTLAEARTKARRWLEIREQGDDPKELERKQREAEAERKALTFESVFEDYVTRVVSKRRHGVRDEREMRKELLPVWKTKPLDTITKRDVVKVIDSITARGAERQAHNVYGHVRGFFRWAIGRGAYDIEASPTDRLRPAELIGKKATRDRILDDKEIAAFWRACDNLGYPFGPLHQLLLLTGARKNEVGQARWSEIDLDARTLTVPAARYKTGVEHVVPLVDDAMAIIEKLPRFADCDYLFTFDGRRPVAPYTHDAKQSIDQFMIGELGTLTPFVVHDLRRSVRSRLSALHVATEVAEAVLGHQRRGVIGVYDRYEYLDEKRTALEAWSVKLRSIIEPDAPSNIVPLRGA